MNEIIGRDNELAQLEEVLKANQPVVVCGPAGIGKTTLVKQFVNQQLQLGAEQSIIHWFSFKHRFSLCGFASFLEKIGTKMAGEYYHQLPDEDKEEVVIKTLCQSSALVVLDNFEAFCAHNANGTKSYWDEADRRKLFSFIAKLEGKEANLIIITHRSSDLDSLGFSITTLKLSGMIREDQAKFAENIFGEIGIDSPPSEELWPLLEKLGGSPLALRLVLPHLQKIAPGQLESSVTDVLKEKEDIIPALMAFSFGLLEERDRNLLSALGIFQERVSLAILKSFSSQELFSKLFRPVTDLDWAEILSRAAHLGLLEEIQLNSYIYEIPTLFSALLKERLSVEISPDDLNMLRGIWLKVYAAMSQQFFQHLCNCHGGEGAAIKAAMVEESNLHKALRSVLKAAGSAEAADSWVLVEVFYRYLGHVLEIQLWSEENRHLREIILEAMGDGWSDQGQEVGNIWHRLITEELSAAIAEKRLNKADRIIGELSGYYDSCPQTPENDQRKLYCCYQKGVVAMERQEWLTAAREFHQAYESFMDLNNEHQAAICAHDLGMVLGENEEWEKAEKWCKTGLDLSRELADILGEAQAVYQLGKISEKQERFDEADDYYQQAIQIREEVGDPVGLITAYAQYGRFCLRYQRWDASITNQAKALDIACDLGHGYYQDKILKNLKNTHELMDKQEGEGSFKDHWFRLIKTEPPE